MAPWPWRRAVQLGLPLAAIAVSAAVLSDQLGTVAVSDILAGLSDVSPAAWLAACVASALSFAAVAQYDVLFHGWLRTGVAPRRAAVAGAASIALAQTLGVGLATGSLARWRALPEITFRTALALTNYVSFSFMAALGLLSAVALFFLPFERPGAWVLVAGAVMATVAVIVLPLVWMSRLPVTLPPTRLILRLVAITALDTGFAALALWLLLPGGVEVHFAVLFAAFLLALGAGFVSGAPGGVGCARDVFSRGLRFSAVAPQTEAGRKGGRDDHRSGWLALG